MADIFLSYSRADRSKADAVGEALAAGDRDVWWDRGLSSGEDYGGRIEREIDAARCVLVAWSGTARRSLWVRAEANAALDQGKLLQINLDGAKLPLPFTMLHFLDFTGWTGSRERAPWPELETQVDRQVSGAVSKGGLRPDPGGVPVSAADTTPLQGFGKVALLGWAAIAAALVIGIAVLMTIRSGMSAATLWAVSLGALAVALLTLGGALFIMIRVLGASRR